MISEKHQKSIKNWIAGSDYDIETAKHMLATGRYIYVVFMCNASVFGGDVAELARVPTSEVLPLRLLPPNN